MGNFWLTTTQVVFLISSSNSNNNGFDKNSLEIGEQYKLKSG